MLELKEHKGYEALPKNNFLDVVIMDAEESYDGFNTHKKAVYFAFDILKERHRVHYFTDHKTNIVHEVKVDVDYQYNIIDDKLKAELYDVQSFFSLDGKYPKPYPEDAPYQIISGEKSYGYYPCDVDYKSAFLSQPYYSFTEQEFDKFNEALFPNRKSLEIYKYETNFSNYFENGDDWWGTCFFTIYDAAQNIITLIAASLID